MTIHHYIGFLLFLWMIGGCEKEPVAESAATMEIDISRPADLFLLESTLWGRIEAADSQLNIIPPSKRNIRAVRAIDPVERPGE